MTAIGLFAMAAMFAAFGMVSRAIEKWPITPPLLFMAFGILIGPATGLVHLEIDHSALHLIAEFTLIVVLFSDAAQIDTRRLAKDSVYPRRLLLFALPMIILLGALVAALMFPSLTLFDVFLLAAILAPTDAALGQAVVTNPLVPERIREALSVESGMNDGIALPAVIFFATCASVAGHGDSDAVYWLLFGAQQVAFGIIGGLLIGWIGSRAIDFAVNRHWIEGPAEGLTVLSFAVLSYAAAEIVGGNGFIAVFVAGLVFGNAMRGRCKFLFEFMEAEGQGLMLLTFLIFGAVMVGEAWPHVTPIMVVYGLISLTLIRIIPVFMALAGTKVDRPTALFMGWFGPRGLASILFALLIVERSDIVNSQMVLTVVVVTVGLSIILHGISASPLAKAYGNRNKTKNMTDPDP